MHQRIEIIAVALEDVEIPDTATGVQEAMDCVRDAVNARLALITEPFTILNSHMDTTPGEECFFVYVAIHHQA